MVLAVTIIDQGLTYSENDDNGLGNIFIIDKNKAQRDHYARSIYDHPQSFRTKPIIICID